MSTGKIHNINHPVGLVLKTHTCSKQKYENQICGKSLPGLLASPETFKNKVLISSVSCRDDFLQLVEPEELYDELLLSSVSLPEELELLHIRN